MYDTNRLIDAVAGKLACDGLTTQNYSSQTAKEILSNCVAARACIKCLEDNEVAIQKLLPHTLFEVQ